MTHFDGHDVGGDKHFDNKYAHIVKRQNDEKN